MYNLVSLRGGIVRARHATASSNSLRGCSPRRATAVAPVKTRSRLAPVRLGSGSSLRSLAAESPAQPPWTPVS